MPPVTAGTTNAPAIMIAEKSAATIPPVFRYTITALPTSPECNQRAGASMTCRDARCEGDAGGGWIDYLVAREGID